MALLPNEASTPNCSRTAVFTTACTRASSKGRQSENLELPAQHAAVAELADRRGGEVQIAHEVTHDHLLRRRQAGDQHDRTCSLSEAVQDQHRAHAVILVTVGTRARARIVITASLFVARRQGDPGPERGNDEPTGLVREVIGRGDSPPEHPGYAEGQGATDDQPTPRPLLEVIAPRDRTTVVRRALGST